MNVDRQALLAVNECLRERWGINYGNGITTIYKTKGRTRMKKKILSVLLAAAMVGTMASGCGSKEEEQAQKGDGNSITVLVESGSPAEALAKETAARLSKIVRNG